MSADRIITNVRELDDVVAAFPGAVPVASQLFEGVQGLALFEVVGHSYTVAGPTAGANREQEGYVDRVAWSMGTARRNNRGWGGAVACWPQAGANGDGGFGWVNQQVARPGSAGADARVAGDWTPRSQVVAPHYGLNDLARTGSQKPRPFIEAMRNIIGRHCAACIFEAETDAAWAFTNAAGAAPGGWSTTANSNVYSSGSAKTTTTVGDKAKLTLPADFPGGLAAAVVLSFVQGAYQVTIGVKIDGVAQPDIVVDVGQVCDTENAKGNEVRLRFGTDGLLAAGARQIELTFKAATLGGAFFTVDHGAVEADPLDGPIFLAPLLNRVPDYSLWNAFAHGPNAAVDPMNDAAMATFNAAYLALLAEFPNRAIPVDIDTVLANDPANFQGGHPNARGYGLIARAMREAVFASGLLTPRVLAAPTVDMRRFFDPVGTVGRILFSNGWTNFGNPYLPVGLHRDLANELEMRGAAKSGSAGNATMLTTLPGSRPSATRVHPALASGGVIATAQMSAAGVFNFLAGGSVTATWLDGIKFAVDQ